MKKLIIIAFVLVESAVAQTPKVIVGSGLVTSSGAIESQASPFNFQVQLGANSSYCCTISTNDIGAFINSVTHFSTSSTPVAFTLRGGMHPAVLADGPSTAGAARACMLTTFGGAFTVSANFGGSNGTGTSGVVRAACDQTALFGGYNTSAAELNFLEISNRTASDIGVRVVGTNEFSPSNGFSQSFVLIAGRRFDLALHEIVPAGAFGSIVVSHDATIGSLGVAVSQYRVTSTSPLEFQLVGRIPFEIQN